MKHFRFPFSCLPLLLLVLALCVGCKNKGSRSSSQNQGASPFITASDGRSVSAYSDSEGLEGLPSDDETDTPAIRFISNGRILPSRGAMRLLFESVSYASARVRVRRIQSSNILQYMQLDTYDTQYHMNKVATIVADTLLTLGSKDAEHLRRPATYGLDLSELIKPESGSIYRVEIRGLEPLVEEEDDWISEESFGAYSTYQQRFVDLLASDMALIAKGGDDRTEVFAYNILSGQPISGVRVKLFDYAQYELAQGQTDAQGHVCFPGHPTARFVTAQQGRQYAYLDLKYEKALSISNFDTDGATHPAGIKAYIFGERGVWRPGDTLHVSAITMFDGNPLPAGHPVTARLYNPASQLVQEQTQRVQNGSNLYHFPFVTAPDAPTGRWEVRLTVGGQVFSKGLRVETIKPNKLDISLHFNQPYITPEASCKGEISVRWLYGAAGSGLKVVTSMEFSRMTTAFKEWPDYDFFDSVRAIDPYSMTFPEITTNEEGLAHINTNLNFNKFSLPGKLRTDFTLQAFEPGGEFSTTHMSIPMSPYKTYVGMRTRMDKTPWDAKFLRADKSHLFEVATVDADGRGVSVPNLKVEVYHVDWYWWWNASGEYANYMASDSKECVFAQTIRTENGKGSFRYDWADAPDGVYYIRVLDEDGGHACSMVCNVERTDEDSVADASPAAAQLNMAIDKKSYRIGETARITIPSAEGATAFVSIEKGGQVLGTKRLACRAGSTEIQVQITADMMPNAYAHIMLIQPYARVQNDAPIRLYGIQNILVEDAASRLSPVLELPAKVKPESEMQFRVREASGRPMQYVVALVDEGLLSLTGFKTPDAWKGFYEKEALRVRTWDLYDQIIGAYGARIEQLFAIGGDEESTGALKRKGADRFPPVVRYLGPFKLAAGRSATHKLTLPQYIGSLRAMIVATDGKAQGSADAHVEVSQPMMVQATLPRTLGPGETIRVPVTLMTLEEGVGEVELSIKTNAYLIPEGPASLRVKAPAAGQQSVSYFTLRTPETAAACGVAEVQLSARSRAGQSVCRVELDVLPHNAPATRGEEFLLEPGTSRELQAVLFGLDGTHRVSVELSSIPAIRLGKRLDYLMSYPYGCLEQTVSAVFPQLYLPELMDCTPEVRTRISRQVTAAILRLQRFRLENGLLAFWPGEKSGSPFGSAYALHFLQEAENHGYAVPADLKNGLIRILAKVAGDKTKDGFARCYALYALAAAGKPHRSAMNLLRDEKERMSSAAVWMLAAAYALDGKKQVAESLTTGLPYDEGAGNDFGRYGSADRNRAVALRTLLLMGEEQRAFTLARDIAGSLNDARHYMSTQTTAWALYAISDYARAYAGDGIEAGLQASGKSYGISTRRCMAEQEVPVPAKATGTLPLKLENKGRAPLHVILSTTAIPKVGEETAAANGISLKLAYEDEQGKPLPLDSLRSGRNFRAVVTVTNTGNAPARDLALAHKIPSAWEIRQLRLQQDEDVYPAGIRYQDIRDDRVHTFMDLDAGSSITVSIPLTVVYTGHFYLPAVSCEAMYDSRISALLPGRWIDVR